MTSDLATSADTIAHRLDYARYGCIRMTIRCRKAVSPVTQEWRGRSHWEEEMPSQWSPPWLLVGRYEKSRRRRSKVNNVCVSVWVCVCVWDRDSIPPKLLKHPVTLEKKTTKKRSLILKWIAKKKYEGLEFGLLFPCGAELETNFITLINEISQRPIFFSASVTRFIPNSSSRPDYFV